MLKIHTVGIQATYLAAIAGTLVLGAFVYYSASSDPVPSIKPQLVLNPIHPGRVTNDDILKSEPARAKTTNDEKLCDEFRNCTTPRAALMLLQKELEIAEAANFRTDPETIATLCESLSVKWPDTRERAESDLLLSRLWLRAGARNKSMAAMFNYMQSMTSFDLKHAEDTLSSEDTAEDMALNLLMIECERMISKGHPNDAFEFLMIITADYGSSRAIDRAKFRMSRCFYETQKADRALICLNDIIEHGTNDDIVCDAIKLSGDIYFNSGKPAAAIALYEELTNRSCDPANFGFVQFHRGLGAYCRGPKGYAEATSILTEFQQVFPEHLYTENAEQLLEIMKTQTAVKPPTPPAVTSGIKP